MGIARYSSPTSSRGSPSSASPRLWSSSHTSTVEMPIAQTAQPSTATWPLTDSEATSQKKLMTRRGSWVCCGAGRGGGGGGGIDGARDDDGATYPPAVARTSGDGLDPVAN